VVYLAEQERPLRRRVALKLIKPGMDTKQVIARFEAERQAWPSWTIPTSPRCSMRERLRRAGPTLSWELVRAFRITGVLRPE